MLASVLVLAACGGGSKLASKPASSFDASKTYDVTMKTNHGSFTIELATKISPATTASFVRLVRKGFFNGTIFHRIVPGFIIQGGDPTASGLGGPGYTTVDKPPASTRYTHGLVAMAKSPTQPPGTSGSQFFIVTARDAGLPPEYAVLGKVVAGLAVVDRIGRLGDPATEKPTKTVRIEKATVSVK
jgi:cyclophilin family peptidyl-prolyl cis-trans isomerase